MYKGKQIVFKYLPPRSGLWHLGEQCAFDLYQDMETGEYSRVDVIENESWYDIGMFPGQDLEFAKNRLWS